MGRPSNRDERRAEIVSAFAQVLATHGYSGATMAAVAAQAGVAPGLIHHHFSGKEDLVSSLVRDLISRFRKRVRRYQDTNDPLGAYIDGALKLDEHADVVAARCWVGVFAEAVRNPTLYGQVRRLLDGEMEGLRERSGYVLSSQESGAILAYIVGSLVVGAFAPKKAAGFAAPGLRLLVEAMMAGRRGGSAR